MPTYEYECRECGGTHEVFQSMKDPPLEKCPECGKKALKRIIGAGAGVIFKGSGFYCTDYRSSTYQKAASSDKSTSSSSAASTTSTSEAPSTTPASTTSAKSDKSAGSAKGSATKKKEK